MFARKPDSTWRFCQDYHSLNAITQRSVEPLPHVEQLVDETRGARFLSKIDLAGTYWQFRVRSEDRFKTSFRVRRELNLKSGPASPSQCIASAPAESLSAVGQGRQASPPRQ